MVNLRNNVRLDNIYFQTRLSLCVMGMRKGHDMSNFVIKCWWSRRESGGVRTTPKSGWLGHIGGYKPCPTRNINHQELFWFFTATTAKMNGYLPWWTCPYCLDIFPSRDDLKKHLEPDKVCTILAPRVLISTNLLAAIHFLPSGPASSGSSSSKLPTTSRYQRQWEWGERGYWLRLWSSWKGGFGMPEIRLR